MFLSSGLRCAAQDCLLTVHALSANPQAPDLLPVTMHPAPKYAPVVLFEGGKTSAAVTAQSVYEASYPRATLEKFRELFAKTRERVLHLSLNGLGQFSPSGKRK